MFDIGFWELTTIAIIGIVVVGPDRLPEVVRTVAAYVRKARRAFNSVKSDIEHELDLDEIRRQMADMDMEDHIKKLNQSVMDIGGDVADAASRFDQDLRRQLDMDDPDVRAAEEDTTPYDGEYHVNDHQETHRTNSHDAGSVEYDKYADTGVEHTPEQHTDAKDSVITQQTHPIQPSRNDQ